MGEGKDLTGQDEAVDTSQMALFEKPESWRDHWVGMPEFSQEDLSPWQSIYVHFRNKSDREAFSKLVAQTISDKTQSIWVPAAVIDRLADKMFWTDAPRNPRYPVYVISKGRWESRLTVRSLEQIGVPYHVVIEPQEFEQYAAVISPEKVLTLPFSNLGLGSIPARNWVWEHAVKRGAFRHWILDDNIDGFYRLNENLKVPVGCGNVFAAAEDFVDRYENVAIAGFNYFMFASRKTVMPPYYLNTRIYSCILLRNDIDFRWRGRYNEDTDLSIRILKEGWCSVLFNAFLAMKQTTMTMAGGNTDELYAGDGRLKMAQSLQEQHPDLVQITEKWGRYQHHVNYDVFRRNKLVLKESARRGDGVDNYGMRLVELTGPSLARLRGSDQVECLHNRDGEELADVSTDELMEVTPAGEPDNAAVLEPVQQRSNGKPGLVQPSLFE